MKNLIMPAFLLLIFGAGQILSAQETKCSTSAWITDKDPNGLNVRSQPNINGKVLAALKDGTEDDILMMNINGYSNGWAKVSSVYKIGGGDVFTGTGWVSAKMVAVGTKGDSVYDTPAPLYEKPSKSSRKIGSIPSDTTIHMVGFDCFGLKVTYKGKTGWLSFDNICGNPETTCV